MATAVGLMFRITKNAFALIGLCAVLAIIGNYVITRGRDPYSGTEIVAGPKSDWFFVPTTLEPTWFRSKPGLECVEFEATKQQVYELMKKSNQKAPLDLVALEVEGCRGNQICSAGETFMAGVTFAYCSGRNVSVVRQVFGRSFPVVDPSYLLQAPKP
jgi:hypothetical protein